MNKVDLPDFEEISKLIYDISNLIEQIGLLEIKIKYGETLVSREAQTNPKYFKDGKAPSQASIDNSFKYTGFNDELIPFRKQLAELESKLELSRLRYKLLTTLVDIWRTQSANERIL